MAGMNRVVLVGRIVRDPELRRTTSGASVTSFTVAVDNPGRGNGQDRSASFIPCTCWNKTAENVAKYCQKGSMVGVDGRLNQRSYEDKTGAKRSVVEVVAESVQFLSAKGSNSDGTDGGFSGGDNTPAPADDNGSVAHEGIDSSDDDLPF